MMGYVSYEETIDFLNTDEYENVSQSTVELLIDAAGEMIDTFLRGRTFTTVPALVKAVNMELVRALLADASKSAESIDGYSYTNNASAFSHILARLSYLTVDDEAVGDCEKYVRARLI